MRKLAASLSQSMNTEIEKPKTAVARVQLPLRDIHDTLNSPYDLKQIKPFELTPLDQNYEMKVATMRSARREDLEQAKRDEQRGIQEAVRQMRQEICRLKDMIDEKPDRKGFDNYLNARFQQLSLQNQTKNTQLRNMISHLDKSINEKLAATQHQIDNLSRQWAADGKINRKATSTENSKLQMLQSNIEFLFEKIDGMGESKTAHKRSHSPMKSHTDSQWHSDLQRQIRSLRLQLKAQMGELANGLGVLEDSVQDYASQLRTKITMNDVSDVIEEMRDRCDQAAVNSQKVCATLYELQQEHSNQERIVNKLQQRLNKCQNVVDGTLSDMKLGLQQQLAQLTAETEDRFSRIVTSYNTNFQQIDENSQQLKQMLSQVLQINSVLTQKLMTAITNKLDCMTFESAMEHINEHVTQVLHHNNRKIRQIGEKEFEVEHELKALKEVLGGIKQDYDKNYSKLKFDDQRSSFGGESDRKSLRPRRPFREVSPMLLSSPMIDDSARFRRDSSLYEAFGGRYNNSTQKMSFYREANEAQEDDANNMGFESSYAKIPSLSDELANLS